MKKILFLCTGNYYRSRFAEIYFNWHAKQLGLAWQAESRGLAIDANNPGPMSRFTEEHLAGLGIPFDEYRRLPIDAAHEDFETSDLVIAVKEAEHRPLMDRRFPKWLEQVEFWKVHDIDCATPAEALPILEEHVAKLLQRVAG
ncbi:arsenate-mycothiol transferase ArsC [Schlesneria paludicola]|uniref:arsenate-mycothiol transferase ArsC n=1 Tax=Schlesneria paludicola TaxID=360056 RepID=UPI00029B03BE|nr:low molecular weight phosphatase family protein [Schlesneria paludicola]